MEITAVQNYVYKHLSKWLGSKLHAGGASDFEVARPRRTAELVTIH